MSGWRGHFNFDTPSFISNEGSKLGYAGGV